MKRDGTSALAVALSTQGVLRGSCWAMFSPPGSVGGGSGRGWLVLTVLEKLVASLLRFSRLIPFTRCMPVEGAGLHRWQKGHRGGCCGHCGSPQGPFLGTPLPVRLRWFLCHRL